MINIKLICVGNLKESYLKEMETEYLKRLSKYCNFETIVLKDEPLPDKLNDSLRESIKKKEASLILSKLEKEKNSYIIFLDETGKEYSSRDLAEKIDKISVMGYSTIIFVIGGSLGLDKELKQKGNEILSFSKLTFPHQLIHCFLLEQLFRVFKINNNERYHH